VVGGVSMKELIPFSFSSTTCLSKETSQITLDVHILVLKNLFEGLAMLIKK
jgi:hypothetical protein